VEVDEEAVGHRVAKVTGRSEDFNRHPRRCNVNSRREARNGSGRKFPFP
jgi:hypothetical protein